ncbi:MerR family transcriptional regulator [Vibrio profundi]|uniref:MerR family transcriptional regulator n=1 Tax=Vibrio profundi TaxID=1774960 RepID=UPI003735680A
MGSMYIGEVSKKTGLSIKAIRLYEEKGLILPPPRNGKYRVYGDSHIEILNLIKEAKLLGVTLSQLKELIVYQDGEADWSAIGSFLLDIRQQLRDQIADMEKKIERIESCIYEIDNCPLWVDSAPKGRH